MSLSSTHRTTALGVWAALTLPLALFAAEFVARETPAYAWDWGDYFRDYKAFSTLIAEGGAWASALARSVRADDYNLSTLVALYPFHALFGPSRAGYIAGVTVLYLVPAGLIAAVLTATAASREGLPTSRPLFVMLALVAIAFPHFWLPTLRGLPDIAGLIPLGLATLLILRSDFLTTKPVRNGIMIGLLIWAAFLFRRWYAFAGVGLIAATALVGAARIWLAGGDRRPRLSAFLEGGKAMVLAILLALIAVQSELTAKILRTSYADAYAAYQMPLLAQIGLHYDRTGALYGLAILAGLGLAALRRNLALLFMALAALITFALFAATQGPGVQHGLPILFWLLPAAGYALLTGLSRLSRLGRHMGAALAVLCCGLALAAHVHPPARAAIGPFAAALPAATAHPLRLANEPAYRALGDAIRALPPEARVAVFASSDALSASLMAALDPAQSGRFVTVSDVDRRDGFAIGALAASHAVVADPVQLHLPESGQRVVQLPASRILRRESFGAAYEPIAGPFALDQGAVAHLYRRTRPLDEADLAALGAAILAHYPNWRRQGDHWGPPGLLPDEAAR
jgi:hypothetical protein